MNNQESQSERLIESISDNTRKFEIAAVLVTAICKFIFMDYLNYKLLFILVTIFVWVTYVIYKQRKKPGALQYWGFRLDNFNTVVKKIFPFGVVSLLIFLVVGYFRDSINLTWHIIPILIFYPVWGTIQQFLTIGIFAANFQDMKNRRYSDMTIIFTTAGLFSIIHYPHYWLMLGTFVLALFYVYIYLRSRNLYALGLFHGWLGGIFFYTVVGRDPFLEVFGKYLN
jgi:membrane protease YdiL (CAAX protease family)